MFFVMDLFCFYDTCEEKKHMPTQNNSVKAERFSKRNKYLKTLFLPLALYTIGFCRVTMTFTLLIKEERKGAFSGKHNNGFGGSCGPLFTLHISSWCICFWSINDHCCIKAASNLQKHHFIWTVCLKYSEGLCHFQLLQDKRNSFFFYSFWKSLLLCSKTCPRKYLWFLHCLFCWWKQVKPLPWNSLQLER